MSAGQRRVPNRGVGSTPGTLRHLMHTEKPMAQPKRSANRKSMLTVESFMEALEHPHKTAIQELRAFVRSIDSRINEEVKWNAPSFYLEDNFATLRVHPAPILQLVLHHGSKKHATPKLFQVVDPEGIVRRAAMDRCVITFASLADARSKMTPLRTIIVSWIQQL